MAAPTGMWFSFDPTVIASGKPVALYFADTGSNPTTGASNEGNAEAAPVGDWLICVTSVPGGTSPATVAALLTSSPVAIPLPWAAGSRHWQIAYGSLGSACTATVY